MTIINPFSLYGFLGKGLMGNIPPKLHNLINWPRLHFGEQCLGFYSDADGGGALVLNGGL